MSAFFLVNNSNGEFLNLAEKTFSKRGFTDGKRFSVSGGELLIYPKQAVEAENCVFDGAASLYCIGTAVYCSLSYEQSLRAMLCDLKSGKFQKKNLIGQYVILFDDGKKLSVITDNTGMYKLFTDGERSFITSSFMAAVSCVDATVNINAAAEQLLCGFVSAPDTLVNEVCCVASKEQLGWLNFVFDEEKDKLRRSSSQKQSVEKQYEKIKGYMSSVKALAEQYGAECGLSGGCDSRLICAAVNTKCTQMKSAHTHCTSKIHDKEHAPVKAVADMFSVPLNMVATTYLPECDAEEIDRTLKENVYYFDCRNAENIGAFSQTHTREYKKATAKGCGVTFSGIGGEIYRNFYYTDLPFFSMKKWLETRIFAQSVKNVFPQKMYNQAVENILSKLSRTISAPVKPFATAVTAKRFFDSYRIKNALSNVVHANNQMNFYLAPFIEQELILSAAPDRKWQDRCGQYEGKIIAKFNQEVTHLPTSKGYVLSDISFKTRAKWKTRGFYPSIMWEIRSKRKSANKKDAKSFEMLLQKSRYFSDALSAFVEKFPDWNIEPVRAGRVPLNNFVFTVCALYELYLLKGIDKQVVDKSEK